MNINSESRLFQFPITSIPQSTTHPKSSSFLLSSPLQNSTIAIMDRSDGKNPFEPNTYCKPVISIQTMLELRAFCADFFEKHVRNSDNTDDEDIAAFLNLIICSPSFFARARAVIPELQFPEGEPLLPTFNANVQELLLATRGVRGPSGKQWDHLPEELAWAQFIKNGTKNLVENVANDGNGHEKQPSTVSTRGSSSKYMSIIPLHRNC